MMEAILYKKDGSKGSPITLPEHLFNLPWNDALVHQVVVGLEKNMRTPVAHAKGRSDVRGGGRKPWRQKGTGRARHGSRRSPLWVGGGVTFGPSKEKNFGVQINKKMRAKAFLTVLSQKARASSVLFMDELTMEAPSTKEGVALAKKICDTASFTKNELLIVLPESNNAVRKSFSNAVGVSTKTLRTLNTRDLFLAKKVLFVSPEDAMSFIEKKVHTKDI